jgi:hypothetical protein
MGIELGVHDYLIFLCSLLPASTHPLKQNGPSDFARHDLNRRCSVTHTHKRPPSFKVQF